MRWLLYALGAVAAAALVGAVLFPLSLALKLTDAPITGEPSGRLWDGRVEEAMVAGRALGLVEVRGAFLPLLRGAGRADITVTGAAGRGSATAEVSDGIATLTGIDAVVPVAPYGFEGPFGEPMTGTLRAEGRATLGPEGCREAAMTVSTDAMANAARRLGGQDLTLSGPVACEDGVLVARLAGRTGAGSARALVRLRPGTYTTELTLDPADARAGQALRRYGFRRAPDGYTVVTRGSY